MAGVAVGVEVTDRDRRHTRPLERADPRLDRRMAQPNGGGPVEPDALSDPDPERSGDQRGGRRHPEVVPVFLQPLAHLEDVAVAAGGEQADPRAFSLDQGVRGDRGPVDEPVRLGQQRGQIPPQLPGEQSQPLDDAARGIVGGGRRFGQGDPSGLIDRDEVGERPSDVDADPKH